MAVIGPWLLFLVACVSIYVVRRQLPERVAIHFSPDGAPDRFAPRSVAMAGAVLFLAFMTGMTSMLVLRGIKLNAVAVPVIVHNMSGVVHLAVLWYILLRNGS